MTKIICVKKFNDYVAAFTWSGSLWGAIKYARTVYGENVFVEIAK